MIITIDTDGFKKLIDQFSEKQVDKLINKSVNDILFDVRDFAIKDAKGVNAEFTIRNRGLIRKTIRIKKAFGTAGYFGSVASRSFSGWKEQQHGTPTKRKITVHTRNARGPSGKRRLAKRFRRKQGAIKLTRPVAGSNNNKRTIAANLAMLRRSRHNGPVELPIPFGRMKPGIYQLLKSGKLKLMEIFEAKQPKKNLWANDIVLRYLATGRYKKILQDRIDGALNAR